MRTILLALCLTLGLALAEEESIKELFHKFQVEHSKNYRTRTEHSYRLKVFSDNIEKMNQHNKEGHSYKLGINQFSDLTEEEFKSLHLGGYKKLHSPSGSSSERVRIAASELPASVDWREKGAISPVKNQGMCGSCWAFATTEMIESYVAINEKSLPKLSTQQITSCTPNPLSCGGVGGCKGSIPQLGYTYIQLFGHSEETSYPYVSGSSGNSEVCKYDVTDTAPVAGITGYDSMSNDQEATMAHLANVGPLAVAVDASRWSSYHSGVFSGCSFSRNIDLNHAVQLVGYGTDASEGDYWIVRNSWGTGWGEGGYIRLQRQAKAECGTDSTPMDGTACVGGPGNDEQHVCGQCGVLFDVSYPLGAHLL